MSTIKVNNLQNLQGSNSFTIEEFLNQGGEFYQQGEVLMTTKTLNEDFFIKVNGITAVNRQETPELFSIYEAQNDKTKLTVNNMLLSKNFAGFDSNFCVYIPLTDDIYSILEQNQLSIFSIRKNEVVNTLTNFTDLSTSNDYTYHVYTDTNNEYVMLILKIGTKMKSVCYYIETGDVYTTEDYTNYFSSANSKIKQTSKYLYELQPHDGDGVAGRIFYRSKITHNGTSFNTISTTSTLLIDEETFENGGEFEPYGVGFTPFKGDPAKTTRADYGWGQDFEIFTNQNFTNDYLIFNSQDSGARFFYIDVPTDLTTITSTYLSNNFVILDYSQQNVEIQVEGTIVENDITTDDDALVSQYRNIIFQDTENSIFIGTLLTKYVGADGFITSTYNNGVEDIKTDVYNSFYFQRVGLEIDEATNTLTKSLISFKILDYNKNFGSKIKHSLMDIGMFPIVYGNNSITFALYLYDGTSGSEEEVNYNPLDEFITVNFKNPTKYADLGLNDVQDEYVIFDKKDESGSKVPVRNFHSFQNNDLTQTYNFSNFYHSFTSSTDKSTKDDNLFLSMLNHFYRPLITTYIRGVPIKSYQGFIFREIAKEDNSNINTYIKR